MTKLISRSSRLERRLEGDASWFSTFLPGLTIFLHSDRISVFPFPRLSRRECDTPEQLFWMSRSFLSIRGFGQTWRGDTDEVREEEQTPLEIGRPTQEGKAQTDVASVAGAVAGRDRLASKCIIVGTSTNFTVDPLSSVRCRSSYEVRQIAGRSDWCKSGDLGPPADEPLETWRQVSNSNFR